jgi:hypothetical protein
VTHLTAQRHGNAFAAADERLKLTECAARYHRVKRPSRKIRAPFPDI